MAAERVRLTITVTPEVHEVFSRMSSASGVSLGKCMGDWLNDTMDGAQFVALKMEEARQAPRVVMRRMHSMGGVMGAGAGSPPSSNTGGKLPLVKAPKGGKGKA